MALDQASRRLELHEILCSILGTRYVYFQPPETIKMTYPAIVYHRSGGNDRYADNLDYHYMRQYTVTVIDRNPDSTIADRIRVAFQYCSEGTPYTADNLHHFALTLYY